MVTRGSLTVNAISGANEAHVRFIKPYEIFGVDGLFDSLIPSPTVISYRPRDEAQVLSISHAEVRKFGLSHPSVYTELVSQINRQLTLASNRLMEVMFDDLETNIYKALQELASLPDAKTHPDGYQVKVTRIELSLMTGCTRESAGKALKALCDNGLVSASGSQVVVFRERKFQQVNFPKMESRYVS